jgi:hypothetical protein
VALSCRAVLLRSCPLSGVKRTPGLIAVAAANDPKRKLADVGLESALGGKVASF